MAAELRAAFGRPGMLTTDADVLTSVTSDYRGWFSAPAVALLRPNTVDEVRHAVHVCAERGFKIVPQGGNTSMCGAAVPSDDGNRWVVLSLASLNRIRSVDPASWSIVAEAGCTIGQIQSAARGAGRHFGLDFGARDSALLGGAIATNAGGMNVVRYGNCRDLVLGLEVVLADGRLWSGLKCLRKDNTGIDLKHLFIGSEGTLGIITAAALKLASPEDWAQSALIAVPSIEAASELAERTLTLAGRDLSAIELASLVGVKGACERMLNCRPPLPLREDWYVLVRLAGPAGSDLLEGLIAGALDRQLCSDAVIAQSSAQEAQLWAIRDAFSSFHRYLGQSIRFDYSVPIGQIPALYGRLCGAIRRLAPDFVPFVFGHLGDGNLHFSACQPPHAEPGSFMAKKAHIEDAANEVVWQLGGSISAEHGIGQLHRRELAQQHSALDVELMRRMKHALDPDDVLNPGKSFAR